MLTYLVIFNILVENVETGNLCVHGFLPNVTRFVKKCQFSFVRISDVWLCSLASAVSVLPLIASKGCYLS